MTNSHRSVPKSHSAHYVLRQRTTTHSNFPPSTESNTGEDPVAAYLRGSCPDLASALTYLLEATALRLGRTKTAVLGELGDLKAWYKHRRGRGPVSLSRLQSYARVLCASPAQRLILEARWLDDQARRTTSTRPAEPAAIPRPRATSTLAVSRSIAVAESLARESTTLRLRLPRTSSAASTRGLATTPLDLGSPRLVFSALAKLAIACNAQSHDAAAYFVAHRSQLLVGLEALERVGLAATEQTSTAQSIACLLRFAGSDLPEADRSAWSRFVTRIAVSLDDPAQWLYCLRQELPAHARGDDRAWLFQLYRSRHFLNSLMPRLTTRPNPSDQAGLFLELGSCTLAAYDYLVQAQACALRDEPVAVLNQRRRGERLLDSIRVSADDDNTRLWLGAEATDSERVLTATSTVHRSISNQHLMLASRGSRRERAAELRYARFHASAAYEMTLMDSPPWRHGIANTFVTAAAIRFQTGMHTAARACLMHAMWFYRLTADHARAEACATAIDELKRAPDLLDWQTLIFSE